MPSFIGRALKNIAQRSSAKQFGEESLNRAVVCSAAILFGGGTLAGYTISRAFVSDELENKKKARKVLIETTDATDDPHSTHTIEHSRR